MTSFCLVWSSSIALLTALRLASELATAQPVQDVEQINLHRFIIWTFRIKLSLTTILPSLLRKILT